MQQEIVSIPAQSALQVFTSPDAVDPLLAKVRAEIDKFVPDVATSKGRADIKSIAFRVTQTKTAMEAVGKRLADEQKEIPKKIDACRKRIRDTLDAWRDEVRAPLTEWEQAEQARVEKHEGHIADIEAMAQHMDGRPAIELKACLAAVEAVTIGPDCEEYEAAYARVKDQAGTALRAAIAVRERYEAEQAELADLRRQAEERAAKDREEAIRTEAATRARREAEEAARAEAARIEARAKAEREAADRRELELKLAAEAAERRAAETEQRLRREADEAAAREAAEQARRDADKKHKGEVNRAAVAALVAGGLSEETAKTVVKLIATKAIPAVSIRY